MNFYSIKKAIYFIIPFLFFFLSHLYSHAQSTVINGKVTDTEGDAIPNVSVKVKGTNFGSTTTNDGSYSFSYSKKGDEILQFSSIGYLEKEVVISIRTTISIQLEKSEQNLAAVVVVGYGTQKRRDITGSVASVSKDRLQQLPNTNIAEALQGSVPGLRINTNGGGAEGNSVSILIRGRRSISASNNPLIVWDGIPYTGGISEINPNDVESIEVLKDASAVAIYGSRGSNGVIIVTSKKGKKGRMMVAYDGFYSFQTLTNKPTLLSGEEFYQFKTTRKNASSNVLTPFEQKVYDSKKFVDWYDLATQQGSKSQHSISVRGAGDKISYYFGGTFLDVKGVVKNDEFKRYSLRPSLEIKVTPWLSLNTSTQLSYQDRGGLPVEFDDSRSTGGGANFFTPLASPYNPDGSLTLAADSGNTQARNPLGNLLVKNIDRAYRIFSANNIKIDVPFIKGLSYTLNTGFEYENTVRKTYYGRNVAIGSEAKGNAINYSALSRNFTVENILSYIKEFGKHSVNLTALYSSQSDDFDRDQLEGVGFPNDVLTNYQMNAATLLSASNTSFKRNLISQMGRLNYGFDGRYLLTLTARRDGYSAFGAGTKYGVFPVAAIAWNVDREKFFPTSNIVSTLKLRSSYGLNGNQDVAAYSALARLSYAPYVSAGGAVLPGYFPSRLANEELGWETTKSLTVGMDLGLFKNRLQVNIDVYSSKTSDLLLTRSISPIQGIPTILQNIGKTSGRGYEVGIIANNIKTKNFSWTSNVNFSSSRDKIVDLYGDGKDDVGSRWFIGSPIIVNYGLEYDGIFRSLEEINKSAQATSNPKPEPGYVKILDVNGDGIINTASDRRIIGQVDPKFIWGATNTFKYDNFSLMIFFHGAYGSTKDNPLQDDNVFADTRRNTVKKDWWTPENPNATHYSNDANANKLSVNFFEDASFVRLKDFSIAFDLPAAAFTKTSITSAKFYITGRNLATFTKYKGLDPEFSNQYGLPLQREMVVGVAIGL